MLCFRSEAHVRAWRKLWNLPSGEMFDIERCWQLAHAWYSEDRRAPTWRRKSIEEAEAIFSRLGFTSQFWSLR
jgi:hypothetical protein